jgi:flavin-dependent dehydrogenase
MIAVVGGGPAGLAAATTLARGGRDVVLHEAGVVRRHRVCGEFLSPDAAAPLAAIGLGDLVERLGATELRAVRVTASRGGRRLAETGLRLDAPGRGLARHDLDAALAEAARAAGVRVVERSRVGEPSPVGAEAVVLATGRLARPGGDPPASDRGGFVAVKRHLRGIELRDVVEVHAIDGAYVGLCEVACCGERVVNVCALTEGRAWRDAGASAEALWERLARESPDVAQRLRGARPVPGTDAAAAGFGFATRGAVSSGALVVGDAAGLLAPFSGGGQAMALATGVAAARELLAPGDSAAAWERRFRAEFRGRLRVGRAVQRLLLARRAAPAALRAVAVLPSAASWLFRSTRGSYVTSGGGRGT